MEANAHPTRQNRQELFAVAGVAFVMKHDDAFRRNFLERVCGVRKEDLTLVFEIEVQPTFHADLRIRCAARQTLYIIEFKVGAQLQPKQDPSDDAFFEEPTGYGWIILNAPEYKQYAQRTYIVLQNWPIFQDREENGIRVRSRTWKDLVQHDTPESSIARDLLDTLGGWGIASLRYRSTARTSMTKARYTPHAADIFQIVTAIAEELHIPPSKYRFDVQPASGDGAYFGLNLPKKLQHFSNLQALTGELEDGLGWFGYWCGDDEDSLLEVWIYCKPSKAAASPQSKTLEYVKQRLGTGFTGSIEAAEGHIRISVDGDAVEDDKTWFASVFDALRDQVA